LVMQAHVHRADQRAYLAALEHQQEQLTVWSQEWADYAERNNQLRRQVQPLRSAVRANKVTQALLRSLASAKHPDDWFVLIADADSYFRAPQGNDTDIALPEEPIGPVAPEASLRQMILEGYTPADDLSTVRELIEKMRSLPFVANVDLLPDDQVRTDWQDAPTDAQPEVRRFALEIELMGGAP